MNIEIDDVSGGVCRLRLNRPERRNAWSIECGEEMSNALSRIESDPAIRCVVLAGSTSALPVRAGRQRTAAVAMLGDPIDAHAARGWGLVHGVVPDDQLTKAVDTLAARLADGPTQAYAAIKRALNAQGRPALAEQLELEELVQSLVGTADFAEGVAAFAQRRAPVFTGV